MQHRAIVAFPEQNPELRPRGRNRVGFGARVAQMEIAGAFAFLILQP